MRGLKSVVLAEDLQRTTYFTGKTLLSHPTKFGYPIHARCWNLCQRVVGVDVEQHLGSFLDALPRRFRKRISPLRHSGPDAEFAWDSRPSVGIGPKTWFLYCDPFIIPEVEDLVRQQRARKTKGIKGQLYHYPSVTRLPEEVQYMVWDSLDRDDIHALHQAFSGASQWTLPDTYWISRAQHRTPVFKL